MTLFEHLAEFRNRLIKSLIAILIGGVVAWIYYDQIFTFLADPIYHVMANAEKTGISVHLVVTGIVDAFNLKLKMSFYTGLLISSPFWLWQLWRFVTPGLHKHERRWAIVFVAAAVPLFTLGVALGYWVMPGAIRVLLGFTPHGVENLPRIDEYLSFELTLLALVGVGFLVPLVLVLLNLLGLVSGKRMLRWWRWIIIVTLFVAALATPTGDPVTMGIIAVPLLVLIFAAVGISLLNDRRRRRLSTEPDYDKLDDDEASPIARPEPIAPVESLDDPAAR